MEANPPIYNTNYINDTESALNLIGEVDTKEFLLNLNLGTMIQNEEDVSELAGKVNMINPIHVSDPVVKPIEKRPIHGKLKTLSEKEDYDRFISNEMGR